MTTWPGSCGGAVTGSGDKQAKAKLCRLEIDEVAVTFGPPTGCEVITEAAHCPLLGIRPDSGPHRYSATYMIVQVGLGPAPIGLEEAVRAVPWNEHRLHAGSDRAGLLGQRRPADAEVSDLRQVVASKPEPTTPSGVTGVEREDHHAASHAPHLAQARDRVLPVMNGAKGHRGVEGPVLERNALRDSSHARCCACGTLRTHERRRFHRGDVTAGGLVGAGASPDIQYRPRIAERSPDPCGDPRLGAPRHGVSGSDGVIQLRAGHVAASLAVTIPTPRTWPCVATLDTWSLAHHFTTLADLTFRRSVNDRLCPRHRYSSRTPVAAVEHRVGYCDHDGRRVSAMQ